MNIKLLIAVLLITFGVNSCDRANKSAASSGAHEAGTAKSALISASELNEKNDSIVLVDVRTAKEFNSGHIENAINFDIYSDEFKQNLTTLDTNAPVYVYCKIGGRSGKAAKIMLDMGFQEVYDLEGGIKSWKRQNLKLVTK